MGTSSSWRSCSLNAWIQLVVSTRRLEKQRSHLWHRGRLGWWRNRAASVSGIVSFAAVSNLLKKASPTHPMMSPRPTPRSGQENGALKHTASSRINNQDPGAAR